MVMKSTSPLAGLLRKSPFKPIQEHMRTVFACVSLLPALFEALAAKDTPKVEQIAREIADLETTADKQKSVFRLNMPKTLFMPVDRRDLLNLLRNQDSLADDAEKISQILISRNMEIPATIKEMLNTLLADTVAICAEARMMIEELDELVQVGFGGLEHDKVIKMIEGIRSSERNIDKTLQQIKRALFTEEDTLHPVSVMFWYQIIDLLGNMSDQAENMSDRLLLFLSK